jgi:DNA-binding GntR family transcriptional regulator
MRGVRGASGNPVTGAARMAPPRRDVLKEHDMTRPAKSSPSAAPLVRAGSLNGHAGRNGSIYEAIREAIIGGRYLPGERLIETRLADEFGVSRTRIRDALARLQADHLVAPAANRGLVVRPLSTREIEEIYALRLLLEGFAAHTAAANITTRELDELDELHRRMQQIERDAEGTTGDERMAMVRTVTDLNTDFHRLIQRAARNSRLESVLRTVVERPLVFQSFYWYSDREMAEACDEHAAIIRALTDRDGERAEELMRRHITRGLNTLLREMSRS